MSSKFTHRRTHHDPLRIRQFDVLADYWEEAAYRRNYAIPHSDGTFFSDGSGYSNGLLEDLKHEVVERLRETLLRLEQIDLSGFHQETDRRSNSDFLPYAREIEEDIRDVRAALDDFSEEPDLEKLSYWSELFRAKAERLLNAAIGLAGVFTETASISAAKAFGSVIGTSSAIAIVLYCAGSDFDGIAQAIIAFATALPAK